MMGICVLPLMLNCEETRFSGDRRSYAYRNLIRIALSLTVKYVQRDDWTEMNTLDSCVGEMN
jgi:hypothetical protein